MRGDGRVFQRGRIWWIAYSGPSPDGAQEIRESSESDSEQTARKLLKERLREVANHRSGVRAFAGPRAEKVTVGDLLDDLEEDYRQRRIKSMRRTLSHAKAIREYFGSERAMSITATHIRAYVKMRSADGIANATINRETGLLSAAFNLALKEDRITRRPHIPHLPEGEARKGFFEPAEHELMLKHLDPLMGEMARFAYESGWRREEIRTLRWEHVDRAMQEVRLTDSKNGNGRVLPLRDDLAGVIERQWAARTYTKRSGTVALSEFVFHVSGRPVSDSQFSRLWDRAREAAGATVKGRIFHDYRRTAVRNMTRAGVQRSVAKEITGHVSDSIFERYNITSTADRVDALRRQKDYLEGVPREGGKVAELGAKSDRTRTIGGERDADSKG